jgi:pilus assembly protein CpaB
LKRSNRLVLLIGVFLAVVAFVLIIVLLGPGGGGGPKATPVTSITTVVAAKDITLGSTVTAEMLKTQDLKISERNLGSFENTSQVIGLIARRKITTGAQITKTDFQDGIGPQGINVPPGQRAIAIQVDQVTGVGTLVKTGDYVDLVIGLTGDKFPVVQLNPQDDTITVVPGINSTSVKLLIEGMQVIGTIRPPTTASNTAQNPAPSGSGGAQQPTTTLGDDQQELVILSVSAQQAEIIKFAQLDGSVSLALRSPADFVDENGNPVVTLPAGTTGVILKTLVDGGYGVLRPELVEAIIPAQ